MKKIQAYSNKLIIEPHDMSKTESGIITGGAKHKLYKTGTVISTGYDVQNIKEGDVVMLPSQSDLEIDFNGKKYSVIQKEAIMAVIKVDFDA